MPEKTAGKTFKLDAYRREAKITPFILDAGTEKITVTPPTGERLIEIGETPMNQTRRLLSLLCGDQWDKIYELLANESYEIMQALVTDMVEHFKINEGGVMPGGGGASPNS